jgi:hypothetical protein
LKGFWWHEIPEQDELSDPVLIFISLFQSRNEQLEGVRRVLPAKRDLKNTHKNLSIKTNPSP